MIVQLQIKLVNYDHYKSRMLFVAGAKSGRVQKGEKTIKKLFGPAEQKLQPYQVGQRFDRLELIKYCHYAGYIY